MPNMIDYGMVIAETLTGKESCGENAQQTEGARCQVLGAGSWGLGTGCWRLGEHQEMLKMKVDGKNTPFSKKKRQLGGDLRKSSRLVPRNSNDHAINQSALAPPFKPSPRIEIG